MATVTLYEYDGETRHESGVSVNWRQVGDLVFDRSECSFDEALMYDGAPLIPGPRKNLDLQWIGPWRSSDGLEVYESETEEDRPLYRAEVKE